MSSPSFTPDELQRRRHMALEFARANLAGCSRELLATRNCTPVPGGKMQELRALCAAFVEDALCFAVAENIVTRLALEAVAAGQPPVCEGVTA